MKKIIIPKRLSFKSDNFNNSALKGLLIQELGAKKVLAEPGLELFQMNDGTLLEFYGAGSFPPHKIFDTCSMIVSFRVPNLEAAVKCLIEQGAELVDGITRVCKTYTYCHLKLRENITIGLYEEN